MVFEKETIRMTWFITEISKYAFYFQKRLLYNL